MAIRRVLVANRGEIAVRVVRACHALGIEAVVAVSTADRDGMAARLADRAVCIGGPRVGESYLNQQALLAAALGTGCDAVHPGYGFLAENAAFVARLEEEGITFIGPASHVITLSSATPVFGAARVRECEVWASMVGQDQQSRTR